MCGIAGAVGSGALVSGESVELMAECMAHRGPDDHGVWVSPDRSIALSHRRLSVIDLSPLGHNPMAWDNGRLQITYNGEIYNYRDLRHELEQHGHWFRSQTDTEVVLAAYDQWGIDCVSRFAGMFAFALWDALRKRLWLARDRVGKKPLYYAESKGTLAFASELKGLVAANACSAEIDPDGVALYLKYGYIPSPRTIYAAAKKLLPGHLLLWEDGRTSLKRYWDPVPFALRRREPDEGLADEFEDTLGRAVRERMISDVPLGAFLSGGIDSSLVVALMQEHSATPVRTFSIRFTNPQFNEADAAAAVARHLRTEHYEETCDDKQMLDVVDSLAYMFDEPFADSSAVPTYLVSRIARERVTVALSGDGGDELFFGYPRYRYHATADAVLRLPISLRRAVAFGAEWLPTRRLRRIATVLRSDDTDHYARFVTWWRDDEILELTGRSPSDAPLYADVRRRAEAIDRNALPGLLDLVSYLPEDILTKVDRTSMAVSLEVRAPLLDHRVVEFALALPPRFKRRGSVTKWIMRQALYKRVPRALLDRPKMGFAVPLDDWFRGALRERMDDYCASGDLDRVGVDGSLVSRLWSDFQRRRTHRSDALWQMFMLAAWSRHVGPGAMTSARTGRLFRAVGAAKPM